VLSPRAQSFQSEIRAAENVDEPVARFNIIGNAAELRKLDEWTLTIDGKELIDEFVHAALRLYTVDAEEAARELRKEAKELSEASHPEKAKEYFRMAMLIASGKFTRVKDNKSAATPATARDKDSLSVAAENKPAKASAESGYSIKTLNNLAKMNNPAGERARAELARLKAEKEAQEGSNPKVLRVGMTPGNAQPVTVREGVIFIGDHPAYDYETGDEVRIADDATPQAIKDAILAAGSVSNRDKFFGLAKENKPQIRRFIRAVRRKVARKKKRPGARRGIGCLRSCARNTQRKRKASQMSPSNQRTETVSLWRSAGFAMR